MFLPVPGMANRALRGGSPSAELTVRRGGQGRTGEDRHRTMTLSGSSCREGRGCSNPQGSARSLERVEFKLGLRDAEAFPQSRGGVHRGWGRAGIPGEGIARGKAWNQRECGCLSKRVNKEDGRRGAGGGLEGVGSQAGESHLHRQ